MKRNIIAALAALPVAVTLGAGIAHADDSSYLDALHRAGITWLPWMQGSEVMSGHVICSELRSGQKPADLAGQFPIPSDAAPTIAAAQSELCPDTLGRWSTQPKENETP
jgi:hypothetical protein